MSVAARRLETQEVYEVPGFLKVNKEKTVRKSPSRLLPAALTFIVLGILFSALALVVFRYALIAETKYSIFTLKKEINELSMKKEELNYQLNTSVALDNIEQVSIDQLGMSYPNQGQMIYIEPVKGYNLAVAEVLNASPKNAENPGLVDHIAAFAARFKR